VQVNHNHTGPDCYPEECNVPHPEGHAEVVSQPSLKEEPARPGVECREDQERPQWQT